MRLLRRSFIAFQNSAVGFGLLVAAWFVLAQFFPAYIVPSPLDVFRALPAYWGPGFLHDLALTLYRVLAAFIWALGLGTIAGVAAFLTGLSQRLNGVMVALEVIPGTILGIILLLAMGLGSGVPIALATCLTVPTIAINTANALNKKEVAREQYLLSAGAGSIDLVRYVYLPALIPTLQSNVSIGFGLAFKVVVLGEFIGSQDGIGYLLNVARIYFNMKEVFLYLCIVLLVTGVFQIGQSLMFELCFEKYFYPD